jgi:hypothetical protein
MIKSFLKAHYCGESPAGNGPDDGCEITRPKNPRSGVKVLADFSCEWDEKEGKSICHQHGQPPSGIRTILVHEMRRLGLPIQAENEIRFTVLKANSFESILAGANYDHAAGQDLKLCSVIAVIDQQSNVHVLRKVPFQKTDADVPAVTSWSVLDLAQVDGDGQVDVILQGDAYEDHWLEVVSVKDGSWKTIFSGLGYYL